MRLCSDRSFPERIAGKYVGLSGRLPFTPEMIFAGKKTLRFMAFKLRMLLSVPIQILKRYLSPGSDTRTFVHNVLSAPLYTQQLPSLFIENVRMYAMQRQVPKSFPDFHQAKPVFFSSNNDQSAVFRRPVPPVVQRGNGRGGGVMQG